MAARYSEKVGRTLPLTMAAVVSTGPTRLSTCGCIVRTDESAIKEAIKWSHCGSFELQLYLHVLSASAVCHTMHCIYPQGCTCELATRALLRLVWYSILIQPARGRAATAAKPACAWSRSNSRKTSGRVTAIVRRDRKTAYTNLKTFFF